jgi:hypothetical protein
MVKKIIHLGDIHIRTFRLHDEYKEVFFTLLKDIKELIKDYQREEVRIVIAGDLVHQKIVISNEQLYEVVELKGDMFERFEVLNEDERWGVYKKIRNKDFVSNISNFMFVLSPESEQDINSFIDVSNETTLNMFKSSSEFKEDYIRDRFMDVSEKLKDLDYLIEFFEKKERYEDCALLVQIKDSIMKKNGK